MIDTESDTVVATVPVGGTPYGVAAASVIGKDLPYALLAAIAEQPEETLRRGLAHLQEAEFLYETQLFPDQEFTFKHALTHEVAYSGLLHDRRRTLHARIVEALERLYPERLGEHVERLAHHAVRGAEWDKAFMYLRRAGEKAADRTALREAETTLEQAVSVSDRLSRRREVLEQSIDLRMTLRGVLFALGEFEKMRRNLERTVELAEELGDPVRLGIATNRQAHYHCIVSGDLPEALEWAKRAIAISESAGSPALLGLTRFTLGQVQHERGEHQQAIVTLESAIRGLQGELEDVRVGLLAPVALLSRVWLAFAFAQVGRFAEGFAVAAQAVRQAEALDLAYGVWHAYWACTAVHLGKGEHEQATEAATRVHRIYAEASAFSDNAVGLLARAHTLAGLSAEAIKLLEGVIGSQRPRNAFNGQRDAMYLAEAYLLGQRLDDALEAGHSVLAVARRSGARGREGDALRVLGDVHAARGDADQAEATYREALPIAADLTMRPLAAHCHLGLGKLYRRTGQRDQALEHLTTATTLYREMDMRFYLEQAEAEMRELGHA